MGLDNKTGETWVLGTFYHPLGNKNSTLYSIKNYDIQYSCANRKVNLIVFFIHNLSNFEMNSL